VGRDHNDDGGRRRKKSLKRLSLMSFNGTSSSSPLSPTKPERDITSNIGTGTGRPISLSVACVASTTYFVDMGVRYAIIPVDTYDTAIDDDASAL
jgi:hypothetical protein